MKESYAVLLHAVIDENIPQRATVIVTTDESEERGYHSVAECGVEDAWLVMGALQFKSDIKYQKLLDECEEIALQITKEKMNEKIMSELVIKPRRHTMSFVPLSEKHVDLPTDEIQSCLSMAQSPSSMNKIEFYHHTINAFNQLAALVDDNHKKAAKVIELQREIVDIHRHYGKEMGD